MSACRYKTDRRCPGCAPGYCAYQYDRDQELAGLKPQRWEIEIKKAFFALPALVVFAFGMVAAGVVVACSRVLARMGYR